jgi:hypothetical protein
VKCYTFVETVDPLFGVPGAALTPENLDRHDRRFCLHCGEDGIGFEMPLYLVRGLPPRLGEVFLCAGCIGLAQAEESLLSLSRSMAEHYAKELEKRAAAIRETARYWDPKTTTFRVVRKLH